MKVYRLKKMEWSSALIHKCGEGQTALIISADDVFQEEETSASGSFNIIPLKTFCPVCKMNFGIWNGSTLPQELYTLTEARISKAPGSSLEEKRINDQKEVTAKILNEYEFDK